MDESEGDAVAGTGIRTVVKVDEGLCDGCGLCISPCAEGALALVEGKAQVVREELCDGAGVCLGTCPTGALSLERRAVDGRAEKAAAPEPDRTAPHHELQACAFCGASENERCLIASRHRGRALWTCTGCLPRLIHGQSDPAG
ncbi:MAG: ferredoxin [Syntrophomonadaceae bacterium]|nr:ferredoxin [Syntrophomonadaceae bacterium]MDH7498733.1 ferredoxin [Syntrophomonadaceae bacterium]